MKLATWNVNSIRARLDLVLDWLDANEPEVLCMQETKTVDQEFPEDEFGDLGYDVSYFGQPTYNGVAIASREEMTDVVKGLPGEGPKDERRVLAATMSGIRVVNVYVPNGAALENEKYVYKLAWLEKLRAYLAEEIRRHGALVCCGDFNIAPEDLDVWWDAAMEGPDHLFVSPPERERLAAIRALGLADAYRSLHPKARAFTWWDYRGASFARDQGMRIDLVLVSDAIGSRLRSVTIDADCRGAKTPSDHVPVVVELEGP